MDALFAFLFKYRPLLFEQGDLRLGGAFPLALLAVVGGVALVAVASYAGPRGRATAVERTVMGALRVGAVLVLLFCLLQPTLVLTSTVPQRNFVGILVDDSRSMTLPGDDGRPRHALVEERFGAEGGDLLRALEERFAVRFFRFSSATSRVADPGALTWDGTRTDLVSALDRAREQLSSVPVSGLVVLTDGADNGGETLARALTPLQAASIPVYAVGLGTEALEPDVQVGRLDVPRTVLAGTTLQLEILLSHRGLRGRNVTVVVEDEEQLLAEEEVELPGDGEPAVVRLGVTLDEAGPRRLRVRVPPLEGEAVERNNERSALVEVRDEREKILYFEGEPRFEVKFVRRAVSPDPNVQVVLLQRTAENKFLRLDVDSGEELAGGFPRTREELFRYRGLILGSVEASFFTYDQLAMISDFVSQRGGGLLALGGRDAFAEGGYAGTPVAEVLPVVLEEPADPVRAFREVSVRPTEVGRGHPAARVRTGTGGEEGAWDSLPPLTSLNPVTRSKPGATVLLTSDDEADPRIVLAYHRFGRGKAAALPVQDTWLWQMHADVPLDDASHETFWQQLLRWMVDGVPTPVEAGVDRERVEPGESVRVTAQVLDSSYLAVNDARVEARITAPSGEETTLPLEWTLERDGEYAASFVATGPGTWDVRVEAARSGDDGELGPLGGDRIFVEAGPSDEEFFDAGLRRPLLERLARETGGRYYTPETADALPEDLQFTGAGVTVTETRDLWDMPALFLLLVVLVGGEWAFRRSRGLV